MDEVHHLDHWDMVNSTNETNGPLLTNEYNAILVQQFWQLWILGGVSPACPHSLHFGPLGNVQDQLDISVVVVIGPARHRHVLIGQPDILCSQSQSLSSGDHNTINRPHYFNALSCNTI